MGQRQRIGESAHQGIAGHGSGGIYSIGIPEHKEPIKLNWNWLGWTDAGYAV